MTTDAQLAIDNLLNACNAALPAAEDFDRFLGDRGGAVAELTTVRGELTKAREAVASARHELEYAQGQLQRVKDEQVWALKDLGRIRTELGELVRQRSRRG